MLVLALLSSVPAFAQDEGEVRAYLLSVKRLYEDFENESALKQIARARALPRTPEEDVALSLYEGIIQADLNRWEESAIAFKAALSRQLEARLPVNVSPKVEEHFEKVRQEQKEALAARTSGQPSPPAPPTSPSETESPAGPQVPLVDLVAPAPEVAQRSFTRPQFLLPAITGGVLLVAGSTSWAMSRRELARLNNDDPALVTFKEAHKTASRGRTLQSVGVGLLGAGAVGLGLAAGWYVLGAPANETRVQLGTDGTSAFVRGRWP